MKQRDIFLVPFPFSDQSGKKVRPVLIVSNDKLNHSSEDLIVCGITSNIQKELYLIKIKTNDLENGFLYSPCGVKIENILKIKKILLIKQIGTVKKELFKNISIKIKELF